MFKKDSNFNLCLASDSYKYSHAKQYQPGTTQVYSYFESRGGKFSSTVFFGLQYYLKRYLEGTVVTRDKIDEAQELIDAHLGPGLFNRAGWEYILEAHNGKLPVCIKAVPEGTIVPTHNVLMTIENTDPNCWWLTNYLETMLVQVWYPTTVCTLSNNVRKIISKFLEETGNPNLIDFKFHDFGYRGVSSQESAGIGGAAHLVNFKGTDTIAALALLKEYYNADCAGFSIPASEHSTITSWGREHEVDAFENMLKQYPTGLVACVSDSFDIFKACENLWGGKLKEKVLSRDGTLVIRPDSGDPVETVMTVLGILGDKFGYSLNEKGYRVLDPHVRVIQGDGVDINEVDKILRIMQVCGWSADNIAFGCGGALLQKLNRDTQKFAFKCSSVIVDGVVRDVYKDPITDIGKISKRGRFALEKIDSEFITTNNEHSADNRLTTVFENGVVYNEQSLDEIRKRTLNGNF